MKFKTIILLINYSFLFQVYAQKEVWKWYFERYNGLDFSGDTVKFFPGCQFGLSESSSSICDSNGNLLFYSNGITLYNKFNTIVKNGTDLGFDFHINETTSRQGTLLLNHPDNDSLIYMFCSDYQGKSGGIVYSVINIHGNNDSGEVINKKVKLVFPVNEPITAVNHQNGRDIWIVCHSYGGDLFYLYLLKKDGVIYCPVTNNIGWPHNGFYESMAQNNLKFSPSGKMITQHETYWGNTETFSFNSEDGKMKDTIFFSRFIPVVGFEYSPDDRFLFVRQAYDSSSLVQFDLVKRKKIWLGDIDQSKLPVQMQLGPDGKIYGAIYQSRDLFVIDKPERLGDSCRVIIKKNFLQNTGVTAMPNFNQSYFYTPSIDYKYEQNCVNNNIQFWGQDSFKATTYNWQIKKKGKPAEGNYITKNINHTFTDTGKYEVKYIASNGNRQDTVIKIITLHLKINKQFLGKDTAYSQGTTFNKILKVPAGMHCQLWQDSSGFSTFTADTAGVYFCKVINQSFCEVTDTIVIIECINNLTAPSIFRSSDTLYTYQALADSFVWFRNNIQYRITKEPYIKLTDTGLYRVEAAKKGHCNRSSTTNWVNKIDTDIIRISLQDLNIRLYPNPANGKVFIETADEFNLMVTDITGRVILESKTLHEVSLPQGVYFFSFEVARYRVTEKVVIY